MLYFQLIISVLFRVIGSTDTLVCSIVLPILPGYCRTELGLDTFSIGMIFAAHSIGLLACTPLFSFFMSKFGSRISLIIGSAGLVVSTLGSAYAVNLSFLILARAVQGSSSAAAWVVGFVAVHFSRFPNKINSKLNQHLVYCVYHYYFLST
jgi:MFS family permease